MQPLANITQVKSEDKRDQILRHEEIQPSVIRSLDPANVKRRTFVVHDFTSEENPSLNQPPSQLKPRYGRASLMSQPPLFPNSVNLWAISSRTKSQNQEIVEMMKKSILELKPEGPFNKEDLIKSLVSGKFTASQALDVAVLVLQRPGSKRSKNDISILKYCMQNIKFFQEQKKDSENILEQCCKVMKHKFGKKNEIVFLEGFDFYNFKRMIFVRKGTRGSLFYIILQGEVSICKYIEKPLENQEERNNKELIVYDEKTARNYNLYELKTMKTGTSFGQLALMENKPRSATIVCKEDCHFAVLEKEHFNEILKEIERNNFSNELSVFAQRKIFKDLSLNSVKTLYLNSDVCEYKKLQYVFREGDPADHFYLIKSGDFEITKTLKFKHPLQNQKPEFFTSTKFQENDLLECEVLLLSKDNFFGSEEIQKDQARKYNFRCKSSEGSLFQIAKNDFARIVLPHNTNYEFFAEHSNEINLYIKGRIAAFRRKKEKEILKKYKKEEKEFSIQSPHNTNINNGFKWDSEEVKLFFSDSILKKKEQHLKKIFTKQQELKGIVSTPKLFEDSLKENSLGFRKGLISQMKIQKKKKKAGIFKQVSLFEKKTPNQKQTENQDAHDKMFNLHKLDRQEKIQDQYFLPKQLSSTRKERDSSFPGFFLRKGLSSLSLKSKKSSSSISKSELSRLFVTSSNSLVRFKTEAKEKLENLLTRADLPSKVNCEEEYGLTEFLPLKYTALNIKTKGKIKKF